MSRPADLSVPDFSVMDIQAQIQACAKSMIIKKEARPDAAGERTALLFTGVNQHQVPHDLLFSQALTPNEKTTWQVMRALTSMNPTGSDAPRREDIALAVGCTETTVTKARQLLRLNRWLTFCQRVRDDQGRIIGDIYLMHEEPWPLWETLLIDTEYALFVQEIAASTTTRYPKAARALAKSITAEIEAIENPAATSFFGHALTRTKARILESAVGDSTLGGEIRALQSNDIGIHHDHNFTARR